MQTACVIALFGVVLRIVRFAWGRDYWLDEIFLVWNIRGRSLSQLLLEPLLYRQGAPPGFLLLEKVVWGTLGEGERALRLVPLIAGVLAVILFARIVFKILPWRGGLPALALFAVLEPLIYYSSEAKQYGMDVTVGLGIVLAGLWVMEERTAHHGAQRGATRLLALGSAGLFGIAFSHAAIFVFAAVIGALILNQARQRRWTAVSGLLLVAMFVGVGFCLNYLLLLRPLVHNEGLQTHWAEGFMPHSSAAIPWLWQACHGVFIDPATMWLPHPWVGMVLCAIGIVAICRRSGTVGAMLGTPAFLTLLASALHKYPFSGRLILFLVPFFVLMMGAGIETLWTLWNRKRSLGCVLGMAALILSLGPMTARTAVWLVYPPGREEIRPVLAFIEAHRDEGDVLYLYHSADTAYVHYRDQFHLGDLPFIKGIRAPGDVSAYTANLSQLRGRRRVWVLFCHVWEENGVDEEHRLIEILDAMGRRLAETHSRGAAGYLYNLSP